jgi:hypothetical protein
MNRKNLTAAVLAGLAGAAGIAGTAQAVNMNPDGLGQVLIYPYYTTNSGQQTILSVVNTTNNAKAVKVRFLEGFNSREVLDFNLYLSPWDVWAAALADIDFDDDADTAKTPGIRIPDDSCTVPYLYGDFDGQYPLLSLAYNDHFDPNTDKQVFWADGGPTSIARAAEGHFEMIEMGTIYPESDAGKDITHRWHDVCTSTPCEEDEDGKDITEKEWFPGDCDALVDRWTRNADYSPLGEWTKTPRSDINRNSGGLFGAASIVNGENGTMYSYNAQAIQGFDDSDGYLHREPGTIHPSLNDGNQHGAYVFFGVPQNEVQRVHYPRTVAAVSAVFMHENIMNEYALDEAIVAATEMVVTFPTKSFYVDELLVEGLPGTDSHFWTPTVGAPNCNNWFPGDENPAEDYNPGGSNYPDGDPNGNIQGWELCVFDITFFTGLAIRPFTELFQPDGKACELAGLTIWDRDERSFVGDVPDGERPPVVSPSIPGVCDPEIQICEGPVPFVFCYETNVIRFGDRVIFDTPQLGTEAAPASLLLTVTGDAVYENGWANMDFSIDPMHIDRAGLVGLPATGFAAYEFENDQFEADDVRAFYGGLFGHKGNVRRTRPPLRDTQGR